MKYYGATTPGKFFKGMLEQAIHDMEVSSSNQEIKVDDRLLAVEQS